MITLYGFGNIFPGGRGETKDLRAQWALEETGLPYRVHALDHAGGELQGRTRVVQWCFAAASTVEPRLECLDLIAIFDSGAHKLEAEVRKLAHRWLGDVERRLDDRAWIVCADFTIADIMMAGVLRGIRKTDLMEPFSNVKAYFERCLARPAWQRTLALYAARLGVSVDDIR